MSFGANQSSSSTTRTNQAESFIAPVQEQFLANMFANAQAQANPQAAQRAGMAGQRAIAPALGSALRNASALSDPRQQIATQTSALQAGLGQMFREEINPAITSAAVAAGGLGGGRQGVAQGVAAGQLGQAYAQGLGDITANANRTALGAASAVPGLADARYRAEVAPVSAGLDPLTQLAAILGNPAILSRAQDQTRSESESAGFNFGLPVGLFS